MLKDILATLCHIFRNNESAKGAFRLGGGFIWSVSVLDGIGKCMENQKQQEQSNENLTFVNELALGEKNETEIFSFLKTLLHTLSIVLTDDAANQVFCESLLLNHEDLFP